MDKTDEATLPRPIVPIYPFDEPGREIVFHEGNIEILGVGTGPGVISATMNGDLDINWNMQLSTSIKLGDVIGQSNVRSFLNHLRLCGQDRGPAGFVPVRQGMGEEGHAVENGGATRAVQPRQPCLALLGKSRALLPLQYRQGALAD